MQLDQKSRGFSFLREGPLDMRMDSSEKLTAEEIVNHWSEKELGEIIKDFGEEPRWRKAAKAIVQSRRKKRIQTTKELAEVLSSSLGRSSRKKLHPATLVFQSLRMAVNAELASIQEGIKKALKVLAPGGKMGVISFHRLEDRLVKNIFREATKQVEELKKVKDSKFLPAIEILTKKPLTPSFGERKKNRRARSAKMRFVKKVHLQGNHL